MDDSGDVELSKRELLKIGGVAHAKMSGVNWRREKDSAL